MNATNKILLVVAIILLCTVLSGRLFGQSNSKLKLEVGYGLSLLGSGDKTAKSGIVELDYSITNWLEASFSSVIATASSDLPGDNAGFIQTNLNVLFVPLRVKDTYFLKLGGGLTYYDYEGVSAVRTCFDTGVPVPKSFSFREANEFGYSIVIENQYRFNDKYSVALQVFVQEYSNGDTNAGGNLKFGITL